VLLGILFRSQQCFAYGGVTHYAGAFASPSTTLLVSYSVNSRQTVPKSPTTPPAQPLPGITRKRFSLFRFRSPLLPESLLFSLPDGTEMFHFPSFPPHALYIQARVTALTYGRVPPFGHPRITARLTAPRGLSRPTTSFIGSWCQGIHRAPLKTWPQRCSHPLFRSQTPTGSPPRPLIRTRQPSKKTRYAIAGRSGSEEDNGRSQKSGTGAAVSSGPNSV
jgi:hypothetical protein